MEMIRMKNIAILTGIFFIIVSACGINYSFAAESFRFIASGDTVDGGSNVVTICDQIRAMTDAQPDIFILGGDIGPDSALKSNMGSLHGKTFPVRGNHDSGGATWTSAQLQAKVFAIGGQNYSTLSSKSGLVYSFDFKNSHFVGLDVPGDFSKFPLSSAQLTWLDQDLAGAESRGLAHAFIWTHPPLIANGKHGTSAPPSNIIPIMNKHKIVSGWFGGHTHVFSWNHLNSKRASGLTNEFEAFNAGPMGDGGPAGLTGKYDAGVAGKYGYATIDVDGPTFKVTWYDKGNTSPRWSKTFTNPDAGVGNKLGDINKDGNITSYDTLLVSRHAASRITLTADQLSRADVNGDTHVTQADADMIAQYVIGLIDKFGETVATPAFSPAGGTYSSAQSVTISTSTSGDTIYYTTDGAEPTQSSSTYTSPITISATTTIKARAWKTGMNPSNIASATYTITIVSSSFKYKVVNEGGTAKVYDNAGVIVNSNSEHSAAIQWAINNLTSNRSIQEKIIIQSDFTINSTISPTSFVYLEIKGILRMGGRDYDLINFSDKHDVTIAGTVDGYGELIGQGKEIGTTGWGIRTQGSSSKNQNITFKNLKVHNFRQSGIALNKLSSGVGLIENCICNNNGQNGIGFGDSTGVIARNNYCEGNRDSGVQFEDVWNFKAIDNECVANGRHNFQAEHGVGGEITNGKYNNGGGDGIQIRDRAPPDEGISENIIVNGVEAKNNAADGLVVISSEKITIQNGVFNNNGNYGVFESSGDYNLIKNNDVRNNAQASGVKISGPHTVASGNIVE